MNELKGLFEETAQGTALKKKCESDQKLREVLRAIESNRLAGAKYYSPEELEQLMKGEEIWH